MNTRLSSLQTAFNQKLLAAAKAGALHVNDASALAGLSEQQLAAAQEAAKDRKVAGYVIPLQNTTQQPSLEFADQPRDPPGAVRRQPQPRRTWRRERHARDDQRDRPAARARRPRCSAMTIMPITRSTTRWRRTARPRSASSTGSRRRPRPSSARKPPTSARWPRARARTSSRPRRTGTIIPSRSASSATRSTTTS